MAKPYTGALVVLAAAALVVAPLWGALASDCCAPEVPVLPHACCAGGETVSPAADSPASPGCSTDCDCGAPVVPRNRAAVTLDTSRPGPSAPVFVHHLPPAAIVAGFPQSSVPWRLPQSGAGPPRFLRLQSFLI